MKNRYKTKESALISKSDGSRTKIFFVVKKSFWGWSELNMGDREWLWYRNGGSVFGQDSFHYFSSQEKAEECINNLLNFHES